MLAVHSKDIALLLRQAAALHQAGQLAEAQAIYRQVLENHPSQIQALLGYASVLEKSGDTRAALEQLTHAQDLVPGSDIVQQLRAQLLIKLERHDEAIALLQALTARNPALPDALYWLAKLHLQHARPEAALAPIAQAARLQPAVIKYRHLHAKTLIKLERFDDAAAVVAETLRLSPNDHRVMLQLGAIRIRQKRYGDAIETLQRLRAIAPSFTPVHYNLGVALMHTRRFEAAEQSFAAAIAAYPGDTSALCCRAHCLREIGRVREADRLEDWDRLIVPYDIADFDGEDRASFHAKLREFACTHPTKQWEKKGNATYGGYHTGNLLETPSPLMDTFAGAIRRHVARYIETLKTGMETDHPFLQNIPRDYRINLWAVLMQAEGHQSAHIHPSAWLSGCYYLAVPPEVASQRSDNTRAGWIEFGEPASELPYSFEPRLFPFKPKEGTMILFPSYFHHRTIPFQSAEQRISLAFDIVPRHHQEHAV